METNFTILLALVGVMVAGLCLWMWLSSGRDQTPRAAIARIPGLTIQDQFYSKDFGVAADFKGDRLVIAASGLPGGTIVLKRADIQSWQRLTANRGAVLTIRTRRQPANIDLRFANANDASHWDEVLQRIAEGI